MASKWDNEFYVLGYKLASQGCTQEEIATHMGVKTETLRHWIKTKPAFRSALKQGREQCKGTAPGVIADYMHYVYGLLPPNLKRLYDEIKQFHEEKKPLKRIDALLRLEGKRARQYLFLQALVSSNFNPSMACRFVAISVDTFQQWVREEPEFANLMQQMQVHKKNLFESALIRLVKLGEPSAVMFANKTINRDRGFSEKTEIHHSGEVHHLHHHKVVAIENLNLPLEIRRVLLEAVREQLPVKTKTVQVIESKYSKDLDQQEQELEGD